MHSLAGGARPVRAAAARRPAAHVVGGGGAAAAAVAPLRRARCCSSSRRRSQPSLIPAAAAASSSSGGIGGASSTATAAAAAATAAPAAATAAAGAEGLVFGRGAPGAWDSAAVGNPVVRCFVGDNEQRWFMWYSGRGSSSSGSSGSSDDGGSGDGAKEQQQQQQQQRQAAADLDALQSVAPAAGSVGVAVSRDGVTWLRGGGAVEGHRGAAEMAADVGAVLGPNADNWWTLDTCHLCVSDVQVLSNTSVSSGVGVYWMFYAGGDFEPVALPAGLPGSGSSTTSTTSSGSGTDGEDAAAAAPLKKVEGLRMRPGLAMSQDGRNWARIEADHHTGALFDVGAPGEWDEAFVGHPQVVAAGPRDMRLFYHSFDARAGRFRVGLATSRDGFSWRKEAAPVFDGGPRGAFDGAGAAACHVVRDPDARGSSGGRFLMFYEAVAEDGTRSVGLAVSQDGRTNWQRQPAPLLSPGGAPGAWDAGGVGAPCAVAMNGGRWRLYYAGRAARLGAWEGIGVALGGPAEGHVAGEGPLAFKRRAAGGGSGSGAATPAAASSVDDDGDGAQQQQQ